MSVGIATVMSGSNIVRVMSVPSIPFILHDDDEATHPFQVDISLMQISDQTNDNLFAAAYIRPVYDLDGGTRTNNFKLNVQNRDDAIHQLNAGRDFASSMNFWKVYIQGAFQGMTWIQISGKELGDSDPDYEDGVLGWTPEFNSSGSLVFVETIRDCEIIGNIPVGHLLRKTTVHETGHQFGLRHEIDSIMEQGYPVPLLFSPAHLHEMRAKLNP